MHTLRYSITTRPLQSGADFRVAQGLLGPVDVSTRMLYRARNVGGGRSEPAGLSGRAAAETRPI